MTQSRVAITALVFFGFGASLYAQAPTAASTIPRYPGIRTQFNQSLSQALTNEQRLDLYRDTVAQGRYSGRPRLMRMFGNFEATAFTLAPTTPGLDGTVRLLASDNRNLVRGTARTLRYAMSFAGDGNFEVIDLNSPRSNAMGKTDADIVIRHRQTGLRGRIEVKNMTPASQRASLDKIKSQILKMAEDARITGERQIWTNRQDVLPEIREFAEARGVKAVERLRTGATNFRGGDTSFPEFVKGLDKEFRMQAMLTTLAGGVQLGMGIYFSLQAVRQLQNDIADFGGTAGDYLRLGEHGSMILAGGGFFTSGGAQLFRQAPRWANSSRLIGLTKWGGRLGMAGSVLTEGFLVGQFMSGELTERQFWRGQASLGGGLVGGAAGGFVGFKAGALSGGAIGTLFGPEGTVIGAAVGGTIGAIGGGFGGGYAGAHFAGQGVESLFQLQDRDQQEQFVQFLLRHYQAP